MPDGSEPEYKKILEELQNYRNSLIGRSYYYIRNRDESYYLCRIVRGGGTVFFLEVVDHWQHGISDEDIDEAIRQNESSQLATGYYPISAHIEMKLRAFTDFE